MIDTLNVSTVSRGASTGLRLAALALFTGLAYAAAPAAPAAAASNDWQAGCEYKSAPQGYGDNIRYNNCMRQFDCERLANAAGTTMFSAGCFGVAPDAPAAFVSKHPAR